ncbi:MAG: prepilin-type N-terminal cleavage/methylation domain-containing protein [Actinobacteria bacterium]|nr:MAG: prepilin-type N-terminal cleavage/methylation domain-containing protein [Actinomycetota bacterium]
MPTRAGALSVIRTRMSEDGGFTLIELLVVILIIGILAGIAIPNFINQTHKASDGAAKVLVRTAETAAESYATDHGGAYTGMSVAELQAIEPTLKEKSSAELLVGEANGAGGYLVEAKSTGSGHTFAIERNGAGELARTCAPEAQGGCPSGGSW